MKVCPKCNSSYSDETLNFCLTDGSPLVADGVSASEFSNSWHNSETLHDERSHVSENAHRTSPNAPAPTLTSVTQAKTEKFAYQPENSGKKLYAALAVVGALVLIGGIWWFYAGKNPAAVNANSTANRNSVTPNASTPQPPRVAVQLAPEQEARLKKEVGDFIESWRKTNEERDIDKHLDHYAGTLEFFYKESDINRNRVRASRQQAYEMYPTMSLQVDKLKVTPETEMSATAVFDKSWTFKNDKKTTTGSVQQELRLVKQNNKWQIVGEKDLNVYFINNRINEESNSQANTTNANTTNENTTNANAVNANTANANN